MRFLPAICLLALADEGGERLVRTYDIRFVIDPDPHYPLERRPYVPPR